MGEDWFTPQYITGYSITYLTALVVGGISVGCTALAASWTIVKGWQLLFNAK